MPRNPDPDTTSRTCLKCGKEFDSKGPGNRICKRCAYDNRHLGLSERFFEAERGAKRRNAGIIEVPEYFERASG